MDAEAYELLELFREVLFNGGRLVVENHSWRVERNGRSYDGSGTLRADVFRRAWRELLNAPETPDSVRLSP